MRGAPRRAMTGRHLIRHLIHRLIRRLIRRGAATAQASVAAGRNAAIAPSISSRANG